jgi:hypothetical protein
VHFQLRALGLVTLIGIWSACIGSPAGPAIVYMDVRGPVAAGPESGVPKRGESCVKAYFGLFAGGDASIERAKANGNINEVTTVDFHSNNLLGVSTFCTVVYGK